MFLAERTAFITAEGASLLIDFAASMNISLKSREFFRVMRLSICYWGGYGGGGGGEEYS